MGWYLGKYQRGGGVWRGVSTAQPEYYHYFRG